MLIDVCVASAFSKNNTGGNRDCIWKITFDKLQRTRLINIKKMIFISLVLCDIIMEMVSKRME